MKAHIEHHFTVDVEEYFQVSAFEPHVSRTKWDRFESRVTSAVDTLLALLERHGARQGIPSLWGGSRSDTRLVKAIGAAGHEVASHGLDHRRVTEQSPEQFRESVRRTKAVLEDIVGQPVVGFRAPSFSIVPGREWALDLLIEEGYTYDSSLFPISRRGYGYAGGARDPHLLKSQAGTLVELPPATLRRAGINFPAAGGAYFRPFHALRVSPSATAHVAACQGRSTCTPGSGSRPAPPDVSWSADAPLRRAARTVPRLRVAARRVSIHPVRGVVP